MPPLGEVTAPGWLAELGLCCWSGEAKELGDTVGGIKFGCPVGGNDVDGVVVIVGAVEVEGAGPTMIGGCTAGGGSWTIAVALNWTNTPSSSLQLIPMQSVINL